MREFLMLIITVILLVLLTSVFGIGNRKNFDFSSCVGCSAKNCSNMCKNFLPSNAIRIAAFGNIIGYYNEKLTDVSANEVGDEPQPAFTCPRLVVKSGSQDIIEPLVDMYRGGNTVNEIDNNGNLVVNLDLRNLNKHYMDKIIQSTEDNPVSANVYRLEFWGSGAPECFSFLKILDVK